MTTAAAVLEIARGQLGVREEPAGSNRVRYGDWYGVTGPWCAMFVSWCTFTAGVPLPASTAKGFAWTPAGAAWFRSLGRWTADPAPGHVVFFDFPADDVDRISHVGLVESVEADGTLVTIEGNTDAAGGRTGGQVLRRRRRSGVVGFGVPPYSDSGFVGGDPVPVAPAAARPTLPGLLVRGSRGRQVRMLQARLVQLGHGPLDVDGDLGPRTASAVRAFQSAAGLDPDGVVGPSTWSALWAG
ncbi:peptidoglycan-binding protein [Kineococcus gynurae]|uniref:Peptidoglycan-binding protein n=1 Tax=Kineococcus gynurae TaxID=452979 RepID=A0ABV5LQN1_9ACTN